MSVIVDGKKIAASVIDTVKSATVALELKRVASNRIRASRFV